MLCALMVDIDAIVETLTSVPVGWKSSSGEGNGCLLWSDSPGIPMSGETSDDHDRESACSAQSSNKHLARMQ